MEGHCIFVFVGLVECKFAFVFWVLEDIKPVATFFQSAAFSIDANGFSEFIKSVFFDFHGNYQSNWLLSIFLFSYVVSNSVDQIFNTAKHLIRSGIAFHVSR